MPRIAVLTLIAAVALLATAPAGHAQETQPAAVRGAEAPAQTVTMGEDGKSTAPVETPTTAPAGETAPKKPGDLLSSWPLLIMLGAFVLLWLWMGRGKNKEAKKRAEMLSSLKKGDRITTIGGIVGTVIEVRDDEVHVKVDESANTKMRFARWAIRGVGETAKAENPDQSQKDKPQRQ